MDDKSKILANCKFSMNEIVLCYEPDPIKARMLYDAKILDADVTKDEKGRKSFEYYIHFQGWNKTWDRWILENQILKASESNRILQSKLYNEAIRPKKRKQKSSRHDSGDEKDDKSVGSTGSRNSVSGEEGDKVIQLPMLSLDIPKVLAVRLEDDCYNIKRKKKLIRLPRKPTVNDIFNDYYSHCQIFVKTPEGRNTSLKIIYELVQGLNTYFNYFLFTLLLYNFEREQYHNFFPECEKQNNSIADPLLPPPTPTPITPKLMSPISMGFSDSKDSSRSNSRTSSYCDDNNSVTNAQTKKVSGAKYNKKRKHLTSVDETVIPESTYSKRKRNAISCSVVESNNKDSSPGNRLTDKQQKPTNEFNEKIVTRETRSTRKNALAEKVMEVEDNGKMVDGVEKNINDLSRPMRAARKSTLKEEQSKNKKSTKEMGKKEQNKKEYNTKEQNTKAQNTKEKYTKGHKAKEQNRKEQNVKENNKNEQNTKEDNSTEHNTKEESTMEQIIPEQSTKEQSTREQIIQEQKAKEEITNEQQSIKEEEIKEETIKEETPESNPKEGTANEVTPKEETTNDVSTKDETTKDETTKDETTKYETTKDETTKDETTKDETAKDVTIKHETTKDETTKDETIKDETTKDETTKDETTKDGTTKDETTKDETAKDETIKHETTKDETTNGEAIKEETTKEETTNEDTLFEETLIEASNATTFEIITNAVDDLNEENNENIRPTRSSRKPNVGDDQKKDEEDMKANKECLENGNGKIDDKISSEDGKAENLFDIMQLHSLENGYNRLRRSMRSQKTSNTVSESDEHESLPVGSTAKSLQEAYKGGPIKSTFTKGPLQLKESEQRLDKTFMTYPQTADGDSPADIYGIEHLLRLFVKFPVLLSSSNIDDPKMVVILQYVSHFLEYLSKRTDLLVDPSSLYSESII